MILPPFKMQLDENRTMHLIFIRPEQIDGAEEMLNDISPVRGFSGYSWTGQTKMMMRMKVQHTMMSMVESGCLASGPLGWIYRRGGRGAR